MPKSTQLNEPDVSSTTTIDPPKDPQIPSAETRHDHKTPADTSAKRFQMPHLLWLMLIILGLVVLAGYLIPAGQFEKGPDGTIDPDSFSFLSHQTPVSPLDALMLLLTGVPVANTTPRPPVSSSR